MNSRAGRDHQSVPVMRGLSICLPCLNLFVFKLAFKNATELLDDEDTSSFLVSIMLH